MTTSQKPWRFQSGRSTPSSSVAPRAELAPEAEEHGDAEDERERDDDAPADLRQAAARRARSPRAAAKRTREARNPSSGEASDRSVFDEATRSSGSSNVPSRSITPHEAMHTKVAPMGTPQRSCPGCAIISSAKKRGGGRGHAAAHPAQRVSAPEERAARRGGRRSPFGSVDLCRRGSAPAREPRRPCWRRAAAPRSTAGSAVRGGLEKAGLLGSSMKATKAPRKHAAAPAQRTADALSAVPAELPES